MPVKPAQAGLDRALSTGNGPPLRFGPMRLRRSRLSEEQTERLLQHFVAGTPARPAADLAGVNRNTATLFYGRLREIIAHRLARANPIQTEIALDDIELEDTRGGMRRRAAPGEVPLFGLVGDGDKVYSVFVSHNRHETRPNDGSKVRLDAIVYTDALALDTVLDIHDLRQEWATDRESVARNTRQSDSIKNFWNHTKRCLRKYNGVPRRHFHLFLKECEWRFNYDGSPEQLLRSLKHWIKEDAGRSS